MATYKYSVEDRRAAMLKVRAGRKLGKSVFEWPLEIQEANREYFLKYDEARRGREREAAKARPRGPSALIDEDGIIDWLAIEITITGDRVVSLTPTERSLAIARLDRAGHNASEIGRRIGLSRDSAAQLIHRVKKANREAKILAELAAGKYEQSAA